MNLIFTLLSASLSMSAVILLLLLLHKLAADKIPASYRYYMWLIVLVGLILPFRLDIRPVFAPLHIPIAHATAELSRGTFTEEQHLVSMDFYNETFAGLHLEGYTEIVGTPDSTYASANQKNIPSAYILPGIWMAVAMAMLAFHLLSYIRFAAAVRRWGKKPEDGYVAPVLGAIQEGMGLGSEPIGIKTCSFVASPMLIGFFKPVILLPEKGISPDELDHAIRHELTHFRRKDTWINLLVLTVSALHWFNPLVYLMAKVVRADCEAACDEAVVQGYGTEKRRDYGETIIGFVGTTRARNPMLSTYFFGGTRSIKKRLFAIMDTTRKSKSLAILCVFMAIMAAVLSGNVVGIVPSNHRVGQDSTQTATNIGENGEKKYLPPITTIQPSTPVPSTETHSFPFQNGGRLDISAVFGKIKLVSWDKDELLLTTDFKPGTDGEHASVEVKGDSNSLELIVKVPPSLINMGDDDTPGATCSLELMVPRHITGNIEAVNGSIELRSISGTNRLGVVNGSILLENVSGNLNASALNGTIRGIIKDIEEGLDISVVNGEGKIKLLNPNGVFAVSSVNGSITLAIDPEAGKNSARAEPGAKSPIMKFSTVNGSIVVQ